MPGPEGIINILGDQQMARRIEVGCTPERRNIHVVLENSEMQEKDDDECPEHQKPARPGGQTKNVQLRSNGAEREVMIGAEMMEDEERRLMQFLRSNEDVFAWSPSDIQGVSREIIEHTLKVDPSAKPKKQKLWNYSQEREESANEEVQKLLDAGVIREALHSEWLANPVLVEKSNCRWRMCIDFTDLNRACPKDDFPLPLIDQLVDNAAGCEMLSFLDAYSGYHQVWMAKEDEEKMSFRTTSGIYCYIRMAFGLRNAGATFARLVQIVLKPQLGRNVSAYVDDIVVKSIKENDHLSDLQETFANLRSVGLKMNQEKCIFGVRSGKLLGFLVSKRGIEVDPNKILAIVNMKPLQSRKQAQRLAGRIAALSRFIAKSAERSLPFFKTLKGTDPFRWNTEQQQAFEELKQYLANLTAQSSPDPKTELLLYIAALPSTSTKQYFWGFARHVRWAPEG
ncbi:hypothetical protein ACQ4PT_046658 [Festuca glaucescens]